jgi:N-acetylglucosamine malate deacetylase 1
MTRVLVLGAHPDDAEFFAGGLLASHSQLGSEIRIVSVTNGQSGHHAMPSSELIVRRRKEAANAGKIINADYVTWDFEDGFLQPTLEVRLAIIREMRRFQPDLVLTHRTFDYHPDHRAVGQAVQDASYMVMVPKVASDVPTPQTEPIVAYMIDLFTCPCALRPDVVLDVTKHWETIISMLDCHESQFYEWMPWIDGIGRSVPQDRSSRRAWLEGWYREKTAPRLSRFRSAELDQAAMLIEAYEISEYAGKPSAEKMARLFPG